jgi:hypothetical protein
MDIKTLEYMGARVEEARKLKDKISEANSRYDSINKLNGIDFLTIEGYTDGREQRIRLERSIPKENWNAEVKETILKVILKYRDALQHELDEL